MEVNIWFIGFVVLLTLIIAGAVAWIIFGRRPAKFDLRHERLVQTLTRLHQDNPRRAMDIVARALVRGGLVWETDLQSLPQTGSSRDASANANARRTRRTSADHQQKRGASERGGHGQQNRPQTPQGGGNAEAQTASSQRQAPAQEASGNAAGTPAKQTNRRPRRRRRRPNASAKEGAAGSNGSA